MAEKVPRVRANVDIRSFKLDPTDGFLLTRVNGKLGVKALSSETGLPDFTIVRALEKLEKLGVVDWIDPDAPAPPPPPPSAPQRSALADFSATVGEAKYDPKELEEPADLTMEAKKRILDMYYRLDDLDHYTLLGVTKEVEKKGVKRAYFELAAHFHPDRYFNKKLGSFKAKMEILFTRVTEAHDTLADTDLRKDYDAYIAEVATTRGMEAMLERALADAARHEHVAEAPVQETPASAAAPPLEPSAEAKALQARREVLARRLLGGKSQRPEQAPTSPNPLAYQNTNDAVEALKRRYEQKIENATANQAKKYIASADEAIEKGDFVAAASSLAVAMKFAPDDAELRHRYQEMKAQADSTLRESYTKQAEYEERQQHFTEAARSWIKVAKIAPNDAHANGRAAACLMKDPDGDLHEASEFAKAAVSLAPEVLEHHLVLAEIYVKAGKTLSAKRAVETAEKLDPENAQVKALLKRIQKG